MAVAAKIKKAELSPAAAPSLEDEIRRLHELIDRYIEERINIVKNSRDGAGLPPNIIRASLCPNLACRCFAALDLIEKSRD